MKKNDPGFIEKTSTGKELPKRGKAQALVADGAVTTDATFKENMILVIEGQFCDNAYFVPDETRLACLMSPDYAEGNRVFLTRQAAETLVS